MKVTVYTKDSMPPELRKLSEQMHEMMSDLKPVNPEKPGVPMRGYFCGDRNEPRFALVKDGRAYTWMAVHEYGLLAGISEEEAKMQVAALPEHDKPLMM